MTELAFALSRYRAHTAEHGCSVYRCQAARTRWEDCQRLLEDPTKGLRPFKSLDRARSLPFSAGSRPSTCTRAHQERLSGQDGRGVGAEEAAEGRVAPALAPQPTTERSR